MKKIMMVVLTLSSLFLLMACSQKKQVENKENQKRLGETSKNYGLVPAKELKQLALSLSDIENELRVFEKNSNKAKNYAEFNIEKNKIEVLLSKLATNQSALLIKIYSNSQDLDALDKIAENERYQNLVSESMNRVYSNQLKKNYGPEIEKELEESSPVMLAEIKAINSKVENQSLISTLRNELQDVKNQYFQKEGSNEVEFNGRVYNLEELSEDRQKGTLEKKFYQELLDIYKKQLTLEKELALLLGYDNVADFYHDEYNRPYKQKEVEKYFTQIKQNFTPIIKKLVSSPTGANVNMDKVITNDIGELFKKSDSKLYDVWQEMMSKKLYDISFSKNKQSNGAFVTIFNSYNNTPFMIGNLTNDSDDLRVFIHEFGHFFAETLQGGNRSINNDIAEIYSQSLELLIGLKLQELSPQADKLYMENLLTNQILAMSMMQEIQTRIYEEPDLTLEKIAIIEKQLEQEYFGESDADNNFSWVQSLSPDRPLGFMEYYLGALVALQIHEVANGNYSKGVGMYMAMVENPDQNDLVSILTQAGLKDVTSEKNVEASAMYLEHFLK